MNHQLKTDPDVFDEVIAGTKCFEIRQNDRNYQVGDTLTLRKTKHSSLEMQKGAPMEYTGDFWTVDVIGIMHGPVYGLKKGWCIMSIDSNSPLK